MSACFLFRVVRWAGAAACAAWLLIGCGGGVDSGGTGAPQALASGAANGLGSVFVAGVEFDDDTAAIQDEFGDALTADQLKVGMLMHIDASPVVDTATASTAAAVSVVITREIIGPVDSVGVAARSFVVLGQTVRVTPATWFDPSLAGAANALAPGQVLDIYGQYDAAANEYVATRVVPSAGSTSYALRGLLTAVDPTGQTVTIGGLSVSLASVAAAAVPKLRLGRFYRVQLDLTPAGPLWTASSISDASEPLPDRPDVRVVARVSAWTSVTQFSVNGALVDASNATFPNGTAGIVLGARLKVTGSSLGGVLLANAVTVLGDETAANSIFEVHGPIAALDTTSQTMTVRGVTINIVGSTQYVGGTAAELVVGQTVDVRGTLASGLTSLNGQTVTFD